MDYFKQQLSLLQLERDEDRRNYREQMERLSARDRRTNGLTWYPVAIRNTEPLRGDYLAVELERTTHQDLPHQLRFGSPARLFSNHDPQQDFADGIIGWQSGDRLRLNLRIEELPDWARDGKLGVDVLFDEYGYQEMEAALLAAEAIQERKDAGRLVRVLTGKESPDFGKVAFDGLSSLNEVQNEAVRSILSSEDLAIVHGPPGTGKTTTLVAAIRELVERDGGPVLVTAPSNTAVDLLTERLADAGLQVLRIGNPVRVSDHLQALTIDGRLAGHSRTKEVKKLRKQAAAFRDMAHRYKRQFGKAEREQRKALFNEARSLLQHVEQIEEAQLQEILRDTQVVTATPVGANHYSIKDFRYKTVVIDEAGQALEPSCWIPILKGEKLVLAGDHLQLPPTIKSEAAAAGGLSETLLEKLAGTHPSAVTMLDVQYRMNRQIMDFPSKELYSGKLKADASVADRKITEADVPVVFVDTAGCGFEELQEGTAISNPEEAELMFRHLEALLNTYTGKTPALTVAVIAPYRRQVELMQQMLLERSGLHQSGHMLDVNTIDSFQGQERDIVYISLTRSNMEGSIGFLSEIRRMNVAMTRARKKLVVVGDSATLSQFPFYDDFIEYARSIDGYQSAWEWMT